MDQRRVLIVNSQSAGIAARGGVNMRQRLAALILLVATLPVAAQWLDLKTPGVPRTPDGSVDRSAPAPRTADDRPDLSGFWAPIDFSGSILDRANIQQWALDKIDEHAENFFVNDPRFNCLPDGPAGYTAKEVYGGGRRIVQHPGFLAILNADFTYRQVFLDGRELEENPFPAWTGYSVGRWDGDALIIESNGYNDRTWLHRDGLQHTEALRITERYTRENFGHMRIEISWHDPGTFHSPVSGVVDLRYVADRELLESACNESSKGTTHYTGTATEAEEKIVEVSAETLERYVGTYEGVWLGNRIRIDISRDDDELYILRTPPYAGSDSVHAGETALAAQSQNAFECCGLGFIFSGDEDGKATEVLEVHVSGAWSFERVR